MPEPKRKSTKSASKPKSKSASKVVFEEALDQLQSIVNELEEGNLSLSDSLEKYEQGIKYLKGCHRALEQAQKKIQMLVELDENGNLITESFDDSATHETGRRTSRSSNSNPDSPAGASDEDGTDSLF